MMVAVDNFSILIKQDFPRFDKHDCGFIEKHMYSIPFVCWNIFHLGKQVDFIYR
jgi:hypothetical protein